MDAKWLILGGIIGYAFLAKPKHKVLKTRSNPYSYPHGPGSYFQGEEKESLGLYSSRKMKAGTYYARLGKGNRICHIGSHKTISAARACGEREARGSKMKVRVFRVVSDGPDIPI